MMYRKYSRMPDGTYMPSKYDRKLYTFEELDKLGVKEDGYYKNKDFKFIPVKEPIINIRSI